MAFFEVKAKNKVDVDKKPRVYFTCHPEDFDQYFNKICEDIFQTHDCAIYYTSDMSEMIDLLWDPIRSVAKTATR